MFLHAVRGAFSKAESIRLKLDLNMREHLNEIKERGILKAVYL